MKMKTEVLLIFVLAAVLLASTLRISATTSAVEYNPWYDLDGDGKITIYDVVKVTGIYGSSGEPFAALAALEYDSGWIDITDKAGEYFNITHNLNSTDIIVDVQGKTTRDGGVHQRKLGLTSYSPGWIRSFRAGQPVSLVQTQDGGYAMANINGSDVVKTDENGYVMWKSPWSIVSLECMIETFDGGYAIAGYNQPPDFVLIKRDVNGNLQWNRTYGGTGFDFPNSVIQTDDGGYAIAGRTNSFGVSDDFWLVKTDCNGSTQWSRTYGGPDDEWANCVIQTSDGGYAIVGSTMSFGAGARDFWLVKTDPSGNLQWSQTYGGYGYDCAKSVVQTSDGGYAIAGYYWVSGVKLWDFWLVKTDVDGNIQWNKAYGGIGEEYPRSLVQTSDGGYAIAGSTSSFGAGNDDFYFVKTDTYGNMQWNRTYGQQGDDYALSMVQTGDGGYVIAGSSWTLDYSTISPWLVRIDSESGSAWTDSTANTVTLYRGSTDAYWNYVRLRIWKIKDNP